MWSSNFVERADLRQPVVVSALALVALFALTFAGCGSDTQEGGGGDGCKIGYEKNPLSGECEPISGGTAGDTGMRGDGSTSGGTTDTGSTTGSSTDTGGGGSDIVGECASGIDTDGDGLENSCECRTTRTDPNKADTDGDGIDDGTELGGDCRFDAGKDTNPLESDTDEDGLDDKTEKNGSTDPLDPDTDGDNIKDGIEAMTCTDPNKADTDGDGIPDGVEDSNQDGKLGQCTNRNYKPKCANGESDPCKKDTDGDGTPDGDEASYRKCLPKDKKNLMKPNLISNMSGNYKLGTEPSVTGSPVSANPGSIEAHVFEDTGHDYTGFIMKYNPNGTTDPTVLASDISSKVRGLYTKPSSSNSYASVRSTGRQLTTHDSYQAVTGAIVDIPKFSNSSTTIAPPKPHVARDKILAKLSGIQQKNLSHNLNSTFSNNANKATIFAYEVVSRSKTEAIVVGALATLPNYKDKAAETGFRIDDIVGGTALAKPSETVKPDCVSFDIDTTPKVDIIISLDASGSMSDEQKQLSNFATDFTKLLNNSNVDWRVGVTSVACSSIKNDTALSMQFRNKWPSGSFTNPSPCSQPFGGFMGGTNGELVGGNFTTKASVIGNRLSNVNGTNSEFTMSMGIAAVDRAFPRKKSSKSKIRKDASVVIVAITDEMDEYFSDKLSGLEHKKNLSASEKTQVQKAAKPWVNYLTNNTVKGSKLNATVFGLYWPTGQSCSTAADVAHGIHEVVQKTGGSGGSVCQPNVSTTLKNVANASAGIGSGLRLLGVPVAPTIKVKHADVSAGSSGSVKLIPRSRKSGFDYKSYVNRLVFTGSNPPQTGDRIIVPYMRWKTSVKQCKKKKNACPNKQQCVSGVCR